MEKRIVVVGLNHKAAPVEVRERLAFSPAQREQALAMLLGRASEGVILSTCNRMEIYAVVPRGVEGVESVADFIGEFHGLQPESFKPYLYWFDGMDAVGHLFAVASGLDSMILGEPQILGQVREAYETAAAHEAAGPILSRIFHYALKVGKQVRTDTEISRNAVSTSHAAVELARKALGTLPGHTVLLVGAGKMGELTARNLLDNGLSQVVVANRTYARAVELAERFEGRAEPLPRLPELLAEVDVVIVSTGAPDFVVTEAMVRQIPARAERPLILIDLSVPRNVDPGVGALEGVSLYNIDDLQAVCNANLAERRKEVARAQQIINAEAESFEAWWASLHVVPTISALKERAEEIRQAELQKALARLGDLSDRQRSALEGLSSAIINKMLHQPIVRLKKESGKGNGEEYVRTLRELFALDRES